MEGKGGAADGKGGAEVGNGGAADGKGGAEVDNGGAADGKGGAADGCESFIFGIGACEGTDVE